MDVSESRVQSLPISNETLNENLDGTPSEPLSVPSDEELDALSDIKNFMPYAKWAERRKKRNR
ncbi:MAG: hypothetical protein ACPGN3_01885 [Opitutales bacterium]